ncbi:MAG TPA: DUF427 domain-containing protein [Pseudolabrys sp.]|nr:DUF427 domain-containing protein [Pseudolabrys sp.]
MKLPGPDHPIEIQANDKRVRVTFAGCVIADSMRALRLTEAGYQPVFYIPRDDVDMTRLTPSSHRTHCPYKGEASYFSINADGRTAENAAWSYEQPYPVMSRIENHLAFYASRVDSIEQL